MSWRRKLWLAWFALTLNNLSPAVAYAHIHIGPNGEIVEHCATDEADGSGDTDALHDHSKSDKGSVAHCPYCPGFAAGAALTQGDSGPPFQGTVSAPPARLPLQVPSGRSSVRIAQQRAPPTHC